MEYSKILDIRNKIEGLTKIHQIEILRILHAESVSMSENQYGVHINLANIDERILNTIKTYLQYAIDQEHTLHETEQQKDDFKKEFKNIHI
jgi:rubrerythrin